MTQQTRPTERQKAAMAATPDPRRDDVLVLSDPLLWHDPRLQRMLIDGIARDGFAEDVVAALRTVGDTGGFSDLAGFIARGRAHAATLEAGRRDGVNAALDHLEATAVFNTTCYMRDTPERTRVIQWPNSERLKAQDPAHYFDIFEDFPTRETPRFIRRDTPIGSAGSCFALRIAHQLQLWGYNYVVEEDDLPPDVPLDRIQETNFRMAPARMGTLFNVVSMRQMVERAFGEWQPEFLLAHSGTRFLDPFRSVKPTYDDIDGYLADYDRHNAALRRALMACEVFVLTLGPTEAWKFAHSGDFTSIAPWKVEPGLVRHHNLTVEEHVEELERLLDCYRRHRPGIKLIVTVSPVPLDKTYSQRHHVVEANALSKAKLRLAAEEFVSRHPGEAYYFPSYEIVMHGTRNPWEEDRRHVSAEAVERVMTMFRHMFLADQTTLAMHHHAAPPPPRSQPIRGALRQAAGPLRPHISRVMRKLGL